MAEKDQGYDASKDKQIWKGAVKSEKRFLNVIVYSYDGGATKIRILPVSENTNPNADPNKKWIRGKSITGITKEEAIELVKQLEIAITKF